MSGAQRLPVKKTYKLFVGGAFPRSESGRTYPVLAKDGSVVAQAPLGSRKDLRDAVRAARSIQPKWAGSTAYLRGQVLYRVAEMMEGRAAQLCDELENVGLSAKAAKAEVAAAVDRVVWYAGWADKIAQVVGTANPVAGPYFDFTIPEPVGVVGVVAPDEPALLGLISLVMPPVCAGNAVIAIASEPNPLVAITLGEIIATSDLPGGVVNILSGSRTELGPHLASHGDVDTIDVTGAPHDLAVEMEQLAADDVKRVIRPLGVNPRWRGDHGESPWAVTASMELKTVWHPKGT
ncbi:MAG: aldehyde dehydrogenase family protein [Actinomycetota bacterium]|nr:aldehyde dehydrogenase family protein [Actinomycetota bacterium]